MSSKNDLPTKSNVNIEQDEGFSVVHCNGSCVVIPDSYMSVHVLGNVARIR